MSDAKPFVILFIIILLLGLDQYSHVWVLYLFHGNTDLAAQLGSQSDQRQTQKQKQKQRQAKGKISVPRLNGGKMGVLATRSPHRPCPIGLSTAKILRVGTNFVELGGADIVDGSPVLDIKPYVPFCDSLPDALTPAWVGEQSQIGPEPLKIAHVEVRRRTRGCRLGGWVDLRYYYWIRLVSCRVTHGVWVSLSSKGFLLP